MEPLERPRTRAGRAGRSARPCVVLLGAGHAHLHVARHAGAFTRRGARLVLVDPGQFWYSGLATDMLGGGCEPDDDRIDPAPLVARGGGSFVSDRAVGIDLESREIRLASGDPIRWDVLSLNVGSEIDAALVPGATEAGAWTVKPIPGLWRLRRELERHWADHPGGSPVRVTVVGGGASGCEVAANLDALARRRAGAIRVRVVERAGRVLPDAPRGASRRLARALRARGIAIETDRHVEGVEAGASILHDGRAIEHDRIVLATGLRPSSLLRDLGLPLAGDGGFVVGDDLRSPADARVHGAGDCVHLAGHDLPRLGVYGVRQAPVLLANLLASLDGAEPRRYAPQKEALRILNLGDGRGLAVRGRWWWLGRSSQRLKEWIDRRWLERYRVEAAP